MTNFTDTPCGIFGYMLKNDAVNTDLWIVWAGMEETYRGYTSMFTIQSVLRVCVQNLHLDSLATRWR